jgi:hypothetical protein
MSLLARHAWQTLRNIGRILHRLWLEITGSLFLGMAAFGSLSAWKEWKAYQDGGEMWKPVASISFVLIMAAFGIHSLFRARRMR